MNALLYSKNQQPQAWHESVEMIFDVVVRFNIQTLRTKCNPIPSIEHALNYISRILVGLINELMYTLWKLQNLEFGDIVGSTRGNYSHISMYNEDITFFNQKDKTQVFCIHDWRIT